MWLIQIIDWEFTGKLAAAVSAVFSANAAYNSRRLVLALIKSQQLAIRPAAHVSFGDYDDRLTVAIENRGLGPMIIERMQIFRAGKAVADGSLLYATGLPFEDKFVDDFIGNIEGWVLQHGGAQYYFRSKAKKPMRNSKGI